MKKTTKSVKTFTKKTPTGTVKVTETTTTTYTEDGETTETSTVTETIGGSGAAKKPIAGGDEADFEKEFEDMKIKQGFGEDPSAGMGEPEEEPIPAPKKYAPKAPVKPAPKAAPPKAAPPKAAPPKAAPPKPASKKAAPKAGSSDMATLAKQVFDEQNRARQDPKAFAAFIKSDFLPYFKGTTLWFPDNPVGLSTSEGPAVYKEAISFLEHMKPLPPFEWSEGLAKAARDHAQDIGPKGITGHTGSDGNSMSDRIERHGQWSGHIGENISFGNTNPTKIIVQLLVDDGVSSRGHRKNMTSGFKYSGVGCANHKVYGSCAVFDYADEMTDK